MLMLMLMLMMMMVMLDDSDVASDCHKASVMPVVRSM